MSEVEEDDKYVASASTGWFYGIQGGIRKCIFHLALCLVSETTCMQFPLSVAFLSIYMSVPQSLSCHRTLLPLYCSIHTHFYLVANENIRVDLGQSGLLKSFSCHTLRVVHLPDSGSNNERSLFQFNLNKTHDLYPFPSFTLGFNLTQQQCSLNTVFQFALLSFYPHRALQGRFCWLCGISAEQEYQGRTCPGHCVCVPQGDNCSDRFSGEERCARKRAWGVLPHLILFPLASLFRTVSLCLCHFVHL